MSDNIPEVNVQRRRKGAKPTSQAQAPTRPGSGGAYPGGGGVSSGGGGGFSSGGGGIPGGNILRTTGGKTGCGSIGLFIIAAILYFVFFRGSGSQVTEPGYEYPTEEPQAVFQQPTAVPATRTPRPTSAAPASTSGDTWTVMVYQDADDQALEQDIFIDMNEMERIGSTDNVRIITQIDRFKGGFSGNDNWTSARRYLVLYDDDLYNIGSDLLMDLGEVDMADGSSLVDFVTWTVQNYPADRYMLIMSDHGMGWPGGWSAPSPATPDRGSAPIISALQQDSIYLNELDQALAQIQANTGIDKLDLIGMDACLMSQLEVYTTLQPYAHYAVASEETEPGLGWAYSAFISLLIDNPSIDTADLATNIVETYIQQDERVVDDQARNDFLAQNSSAGGFFSSYRMSAEQLASQLEQNVTLTAVNLDNLPALNQAFNSLVYDMQSLNQQVVASARSYTQSFTSIFGRQVPPSYIDLGHFIQLVYKKSGGDAAIRQSANDVINALNAVLVAEKHGPNKPGATGIAIYFPNSQLYSNAATGLRSYTMVADRFARVSLWDDFLVFHYNNRAFKESAAEAVAPSGTGITRAPGAGQITVSPIKASANFVSPGSSIKLSADITGTNIGYIYLFTGLYDQASNSIFVADTDYLESPEQDSLNGVYYPVWPEGGAFRMNFDFEPLLFAITDGSQSALAMFNPVSYGASAEQAVYAVRGTYTFSDTGEQRAAELYFKDGQLFQVFGFKGEDVAQQPSQITPAAGDKFTIAYRWLNLDSTGKVTGESITEGDTLTFGSKPFSWEQVYAPDGQYLVGFLVSDLDGAITPAYTQITVK